MENAEEVIYLAVSNGEWMDEKSLQLIKSDNLPRKTLHHDVKINAFI